MLDDVASLSATRALSAYDKLALSLAVECSLSDALVFLGFSVGFSKPEIVCSFPNILNSALPSFSTASVQAVIRAGVAAISIRSRISPLNQLV